MNILTKPFDFDLNILSPIKTVGSIEKICFPTCVSEVQEAFLYAKENALKPFVLGGGSNTLIGHPKNTLFISDRKYKSIWEVAEISDLKNKKYGNLIVSSNTSINFFITKAASERYYGLEFLAGIPAHLGGLTCMNAGAYEQNISDYIEWIAVVDDDGEKTILKEDLKLGYRTSNINGFISKICFKLKYEENDDYSNLIKGKIDKYINDREAKHDMKNPSLGCFFKNPENNHAGYLIDQAGLKSFKIGGAMVSEKHANFLINTGNATYEDFINLINHVQKVVYDKHSIHLDLEIKLIND